MHNFHEGDRNLSGKHNAKSRKRKLFVQGERKQQCHRDRSAKVNQASAFPCAPQGNDCSQLWLIHPGMGSWNPAFSPNWCVLNKLLLRELPCPTTQEPLWLSHLHHLSWEVLSQLHLPTHTATPNSSLAWPQVPHSSVSDILILRVA